jgi:hypothetical protein
LLTNPTVGLAAHYGVVDVRITAKADSTKRADKLIAGVEKTIREKLGHAIFGVDDETLEGVVLAALAQRGWSLTVVEANTGGDLSHRLAESKHPAFLGGQVLPELGTGQSLAQAVAEQMKTSGAGAALGLTAQQDAAGASVEIVLVTPNARDAAIRTYGGHPKNVPDWGANLALDMLRRELDK